MKTVGSIVRDCRIGKNLSQVKLAEKMGWTGQFVSNIERGIAEIPDAKVKKVAKLLSIDYIDLLLLKYRSRLQKHGLEVNKKKGS